MKRFIATLSAAIVLCVTAQAQQYRNSRYYNPRNDRFDYGGRHAGYGFMRGDTYYGLRIGAAFSTVDSDDSNLDGGSAQTGLDLGVVVGLPLSSRAPLYLETGLSYVEKGGKKDVSGKKMTYDLNYIEVPIALKYVYNVDRSFSVQPFVGGYLSCGVGGKIKNFGEREAFDSFSEEAFRRFDGGLRVGCGIGYDLFYADISYDIGLSNICHDTFDTSHNGCLALTVGANF